MRRVAADNCVAQIFTLEADSFDHALVMTYSSECFLNGAQSMPELQAMLEEIKREGRQLGIEANVLRDRIVANSRREARICHEIKKLLSEVAEEADGLDSKNSSADQKNDFMYLETDTPEERAIKVKKNKQMIHESIDRQLKDVQDKNVPKRCKNLGFLEANDPRTHVSARIALASYPRSGNSLLRSVIEQLTRIYTGSDGDPRRPLNQQLVSRGMMGEGMVDQTVFAVKTHFPERLGWCKLSVSRAIVCVRNPFDSLVSYFNMMLTKTHTESVLDDEFLRFYDVWDEFLREETEVWKLFHEHWLSEAVLGKIDVLVVRFEDMLSHKRETYQRIANFVCRDNPKLNSDSLVEEVLASMDYASTVYPPRHEVSCVAQSSVFPHEIENNDQFLQPSSLQVECTLPTFTRKDGFKEFPALDMSSLKSLRFFSNEQRRYILGTAKSLLSMFGYWDSFFSRLGPSCVNPALDSCLVLKRAKKKEETGKGVVVCNARYPFRQPRKDDQFCRGFGKSWENRIHLLSQVRTVVKDIP